MRPSVPGCSNRLLRVDAGAVSMPSPLVLGERMNVLLDWLSRLTGRSGSKGASFPRTCNLCGYRGRFQSAGRPRRIDARCPRCGSAERYRLLALWLDREGEFLKRADVLHFAPEQGLTAL